MARRSILLGVAVVIATLGALLLVLYVRGIEARAADGQELVRVLVASDVIDEGETVADAEAAGKLDHAEVVRDDMVEGALTSTASIEDLTATSTIQPGQQIVAAQFGSAVVDQALDIPDDKLAISVELTDPERVAGFVVPGSEVAIFVSADPELYKADGTTQKLSPITRLLLPKVQVIGVGDTSMSARTTKNRNGEETTEQIPRTILTVAVDQDQAQRLIYASRNGDLAFALRTDSSKTENRPGVTARDIVPESFGGLS
jgi:pilus assembly protein CpaB